ncbi:MAG TPA: hypothetical protein VFI95_00560 [Terriglobales bacterium]|nr:hypothetical protein [Terriglobales bacterium]
MRNTSLSVLGLSLSLVLVFGTSALGQTSTSESPDIQSNTTRSEGTAATRGSMVVPSGSQIVVKNNEAVDSKTARPGQTFTGTVEENVTGSNGEVLIPRGSTADLVIRKVSSGGTTGSPDLALDLSAIDVGGHRYIVSTENVRQTNEQGIGKNKRTGEYVGGGAALGTIIGAVAGGGKGAAIGALAGAAAGGATQVLTRGKEVKVPAETTLKFRLDKPLNLRSASS